MAREKFPSDEVDRLMLRFPAGMRDRIAEAAKANNRSMNAEIISRLETTLSFSGNLAGPDAAERVAVMIRATAAGATMDAASAVQRIYQDGGAELTSPELYERIAEKLGELTELKVSALRETKAFQAIPMTRVEGAERD